MRDHDRIPLAGRHYHKYSCRTRRRCNYADRTKRDGERTGFVATVVGLGAILEHSGGARRIAGFLMEKFGVKKAPVAMVLSGFITVSVLYYMF